MELAPHRVDALWRFTGPPSAQQTFACNRGVTTCGSHALVCLQGGVQFSFGFFVGNEGVFISRIAKESLGCDFEYENSLVSGIPSSKFMLLSLCIP